MADHVDTLNTEQQYLYRRARAVREKAYAPYSGVKVGAAIRLHDGAIFTGCNVENASFGATVCAERGAIQTAVAHRGGKIAVAEVMVVTDVAPPWPPCGICRQVLAEFGPDATIYLANLAGEVHTFRLSELMPHTVPTDFAPGRPS